MNNDKIKRVSLYQSLAYFGDMKQWNRLQDISLNVFDLVEVFAKTVAKEPQSSSEYNQRIKESDKIRKMLINKVLPKLIDGELVADGYSIPRRPEDNRCKIPEDVWLNPHFITWDKNKVKGNGLEIIDIQVYEKITSLDKPVMEVNPATEERVKVGRPKVSDKIANAFISLANSGEIDFEDKISQRFNPVIRCLIEQEPENERKDKSLSESTLRKTISPLFNQLAENK